MRACRPRRPADNPVPRKPGEASPIKYCIYIIKENRTYDQVLGDMPQGNGDPKLCLFPERVTPNLHQLAREFVLLDNFYVDAEVSADGHEWSMGAYATDFVEKMWPLDYGHNRARSSPTRPRATSPSPRRPAATSGTARARPGVSYRSYGEFVDLLHADQRARPSRACKALRGHIDPWYRGWDLAYPDVKRAERFIAELKRMEAEGDMPRLQIVRLPSDHTHGATPRLAHADGLRRRQRPGAGPGRRSGQPLEVLAPDGHLCRGGRRARTAPTTWTRTARPPMSSAPTRNAARWIRPCIPPAACCARWS